MFRLAPHFENGRGKSPYDPKMLSVSLLLGELDELQEAVAFSQQGAAASERLFILQQRPQQQLSPSVPWQTESFTLALRLISWGGTLLFSVHWGTIIQSGRSSMTQDG